MSVTSNKSGGSVVPSFRYRDAPAAIAWLCQAFGFEAQLVVPGGNDTIAHAQLLLGDGMIMLGSANSHGGNAYDKVVRPPDELGGHVSGDTYIVVDDADAHYARAVAAGAEVLMELEDAGYGGRGYSCRDPEGHVWSFGTYDPRVSD
ncbi:MAG: VOC family protein [Myxococcota bacterium]|nr:VOC family protein [Myxococcota bacterium]